MYFDHMKKKTVFDENVDFFDGNTSIVLCV